MTSSGRMKIQFSLSSRAFFTSLFGRTGGGIRTGAACGPWKRLSKVSGFCGNLLFPVDEPDLSAGRSSVTVASPVLAAGAGSVAIRIRAMLKQKRKAAIPRLRRQLKALVLILAGYYRER